MGRAYSLAGFLNAALRRSSKTVLVEGVSDKHLLHKLHISKFPDRAGTVLIDHVGILDDAALAGMGNRAKVLAVQAHADTMGSSTPKILTVLATLTDREWDGLNIVGYCPEPSWTAPLQHNNKFVTFGHSIENYNFEIECVKDYLKYFFPEYLTATMLTEIEAYFSALIVGATILSLKIRDDSCINRCSSLIKPCHISMSNGRIYLDSSFSIACSTRGIPSAATIVADINSAIDSSWNILAGHHFSKWLPHGHIGDEFIWSGVAKIALTKGMSAEVANEIAHGHKKERDRFKSQWLCDMPASGRAPLDDTVDWLRG